MLEAEALGTLSLDERPDASDSTALVKTEIGKIVKNLPTNLGQK